MQLLSQLVGDPPNIIIGNVRFFSTFAMFSHCFSLGFSPVCLCPATFIGLTTGSE